MFLTLYHGIYFLQLSGLGYLIIGIAVAALTASSDNVHEDNKEGKFQF